MPFAGTNAFFGHVSRRQLRRDRLLRIEAGHHAVNDALGPEIFGAVDAKRKFGRAAIFDHIFGQEIFWSKSDIASAIAGNDIHRRRADKGRDKKVGRILIDFGGRSHLPNPSMVDDRDTVAHAHRFDLVVGHVDGSETDALLKLSDLLPSRAAQFGVEIGQRLVEQKRSRFADERTRKRNTLALAAGKLAWPPVEKMADAEQLRGPLDLLLDFLAGHALRAQRKGNVVAYRVVRIKAIALKHHRNAASAGRDVVDEVAADQEIAARLLLEAANDAQKRRLAAARGAKQHHEFAVWHRKRNAVDGGDLAELLDDIPGEYRCHRTSRNQCIALRRQSFDGAPIVFANRRQSLQR